jgi:hypothetical protein
MNSAVYTCECCGKRTRETGNDESTREMCLACDLEGEIYNMMSDYSEKFVDGQIQGIANRLSEAKVNTPDADTKKVVAIHKEVMSIAYA